MPLSAVDLGSRSCCADFFGVGCSRAEARKGGVLLGTCGTLPRCGRKQEAPDFRVVPAPDDVINEVVVYVDRDPADEQE